MQIGFRAIEPFQNRAFVLLLFKYLFSKPCYTVPPELRVALDLYPGGGGGQGECVHLDFLLPFRGRKRETDLNRGHTLVF
jgi:hypothetical protein